MKYWIIGVVLILGVAATGVAVENIAGSPVPVSDDYGIKIVQRTVSPGDGSTVYDCTLAVVPGKSVTVIGCAPQ